MNNEKERRMHYVATRLMSGAGVIAVAVSLLVGFSLPVFLQTSSVGSFEIDGNLVDNPPGEPIDWSTAGNTPHPDLTNRVDFVDASGRGDDIFAQGSKELEPGAW